MNIVKFLIAVNDYSTDNSYTKLKDLSFHDKRIKIVNNTKNSGLLYSRAMGVINSRGEYIMNLDPDDTLSDVTDLEYLYENTNNSQIDIINFKVLEIQTNGSKREIAKCNLFNETLFQPKLFDHFINKPDLLIWNKMIKKEIFLKAYEVYKTKIIGEFCNYCEDEIWSSLVNKFANSKKCLNRIIYVYIRNDNSIILKMNYDLYCNNMIDWNEMFIYKIFSERKAMARTVTIRFLNKILNKDYFFRSIKTNKLLTKKYITYLSTIRNKFIGDSIILDKINYILNVLIPLREKSF